MLRAPTSQPDTLRPRIEAQGRPSGRWFLSKHSCAIWRVCANELPHSGGQMCEDAAHQEGSGAGCPASRRRVQMSEASRRWRFVLVGAVVTGLFVVPAQSFASGSISPKAKKAIRAQLRKSVKKNPSVLRHRSFLKKAALVNFKLPVTIRLRNPCTQENGANPAPTVGGNPVGRRTQHELPDAGHGAEPALCPVGHGEPRARRSARVRFRSAVRSRRSSSSATRTTVARWATSTSSCSRRPRASSARRPFRCSGTTTSWTRRSATMRTS